MAKYGITPAKTYGVTIPNSRKIAKEIGADHKLAQQLWASDIRETRILASMIEGPEMVTEGGSGKVAGMRTPVCLCLAAICSSPVFTMIGLENIYQSSQRCFQ